MIPGQRVRHREYNTTGVFVGSDRNGFVVRLDGYELPLNPMTIDYMDRWEVIDDRM